MTRDIESDRPRIVIDPVVVRLFRDAIEAHRREIAEHGHCATCDPDGTVDAGGDQ